jgi:hypothetical protein
MRFVQIAFLLLAFLFIPKEVYAKSFYFPQVVIDITVNPDSSLKVVEKRTFSFDGSFTQVYWDIPLEQNQIIDNVALSETSENVTYEEIPVVDAGRPAHKFATERNGAFQHIEVWHSSYNQTREFVLTYTVTNAVTSYSDVSELYWQAVGDAWGSKTDYAEITVHLPQTVAKENIYVWGHGPLNGKSEIVDGSTVRFVVRDVPPETFVEIRTLFPVSIINSGPKINENALARIKREEKSFQDRTVLEQRIRVFGLFGILAFTIGWIIFWYKMWYKHGRDYYP